MTILQILFVSCFSVLFFSCVAISFLAWLNQHPVTFLWMKLLWSLMGVLITVSIVITGQIIFSYVIDILVAICVVVFCVYFNYNFALDAFGSKKVTIVSSLKISDIIIRDGNNEGFILETNSKQKIKLLFRYKQFGDDFIGVSPELSKWVWDRWDDDYSVHTSGEYKLNILPNTGYIVGVVRVN